MVVQISGAHERVRYALSVRLSTEPSYILGFFDLYSILTNCSYDNWMQSYGQLRSVQLLLNSGSVETKNCVPPDRAIVSTFQKLLLRSFARIAM